MVGREHGQLGHARSPSKLIDGGERLAGVLGGAHELGVRDLVRQVDLEPVGRIELRDIGLERLRRPVLERGAELGLRRGDALGAVDLGEAAGEHRLGLVIERAQELRLPAVPHAGADGADVGGGEDGQQLQPLGRLHHGGEILDGLAVGEVARLRDARHHQMIFDQPGDGLGLGGGKAEARAEPPRHPRAGDRMILDAALGDVVQEQRDVEHRAVAGQQLVDQLVGERHSRLLPRSISASTPMQRSRCSSTV